jgi:hypothetical protein
VSGKQWKGGSDGGRGRFAVEGRSPKHENFPGRRSQPEKARGSLGARWSVLGGPLCGQIYWAITFPDWESYGKGVQALLADPEAQRIYGEITKNFELQERSVLMVEDL